MIIGKTKSVCPVCLRVLDAQKRSEKDGIYLDKRCDEHGAFSALIWEGNLASYLRWNSENTAVDPPREGRAPEKGCPRDCGLCTEHLRKGCCMLLELTRRCNLRCPVCFAAAGKDTSGDLPLAEIEKQYDFLMAHGGPFNIQLSGGEPTVRDDLPQVIRMGREKGFPFFQLNTNGLRLAREPDYAERLAEAGLDIVFLQFDGTRDAIYETLRGAPLLEAKKEAIRVCGEKRIGVTLVPTVVRGVNDDDLGEIVRLACAMAPAVRAVHFQPVSFFGRYPEKPEDTDRYTLDRLMADLSEQAGIPLSSFMPSRCDHPLCGFHADFLLEPSGALRPLSSITHSARSRGCARENREYVARHWRRAPDEPAPEKPFSEEMDFDTFLYRLRHQSLTLSAMAFQDAMNLNLERLHRCSLHVYDGGKIKPFCAKYLSAWE